MKYKSAFWHDYWVIFKAIPRSLIFPKFFFGFSESCKELLQALWDVTYPILMYLFTVLNVLTLPISVLMWAIFIHSFKKMKYDEDQEIWIAKKSKSD